MRNVKTLISILHGVLTIHGKIISLAIVTLIVSCILYFNLSSSKDSEPILKVVEVITATCQSIEQTARLIGTVRAKHSTVLVSKSAGVLIILKQSGEMVAKDTLIASINNPDVERRYELALSSAQIAKKQYERTMTLMKTGTSSKQASEEKQFVFIEAERNLATAKIECDKSRFYAPFNGIIGSYKERDGTEIKNDTILLSFYDPTSLMIDVNIPAPLLKWINVGQKIMVDGKRYALTHVQKMLDDLTQMAPAVADITADGYIIGAPIDVELTVLEKNNVIVLPDEAVFLDQGKPHVYVIKELTTVLTPVELGLRAREKVEITKGLANGDIIVSQGQGRLSDGLKIKIYDPKKDEKKKVIIHETREKSNELNRIFH